VTIIAIELNVYDSLPIKEKVVRNPTYIMTTSTMNLRKSFPISFKQGIRVPQYGLRLTVKFRVSNYVFGVAWRVFRSSGVRLGDVVCPAGTSALKPDGTR
jgi:hypothetical protein